MRERRSRGPRRRPRTPGTPVRTGAAVRRRPPSGYAFSQRPHPDVAQLDQVAATVVLQSDEAAGELAQVGRRVAGTRRLLARRVVELVDYHTVADDRVVLADDADLVVAPHTLRRGTGLR